MLQSGGQNTGRNTSKPANTQKAGNKKPQNKDNLDSREGLEQQTKDDDVTHNRKEAKSDRKNVKNDNEHREL